MFKLFPHTRQTAIFLLAFLLSCYSFSCDQSGKKEKEAAEKSDANQRAFIHKNLTQDFNNAEKLYTTKRVDLDRGDLLLKGWSGSEKTHRWAEGLESELFFVAAAKRKTTMRFKCGPIAHDENVRQSIRVYLNSHFVEEIALSSGRDEYEISLPLDSLKDGKNVITFKYSYAKKPCEVGDSKDCRNLSVLFERIEFDLAVSSDARIELVDDAIRQPPDTFLNYYAKVPKDAALCFNFDVKDENLCGVVTVSSDGSVPEIFRIDSSGFKEVGLSGLSNKIVKLSFRTEQKKKRISPSDISGEQYGEWKNIRIVSVGENKKPTLKKWKFPGKYDVIYIVLDAFHARHSSLYGYHRKTTPFLDKLAEESVVFEEMFANAPYTLASTGTLFTSKYSYEHGLINKETRLSPITPTINELLSNAGISTYLISAHPFFKETWGLSRGFSKIFDKGDAGGVIDAIRQIYTSDSNGRKFIYVHLMPPHSPYLPPKKYRIFMDPPDGAIEPTPENLTRIESGELKLNDKQLRYFKALYDANILFADQTVKDIFDYLRKSKILEQSIFILTSDHGEAFMQHGKIQHNTTVFDEMIHVPFIVRFPKELGLFPIRINRVSSLIDVAPTLSDIFGIPCQDMFSGTSLIPFIFGADPLDDYIYAETLLTNARTIRDSTYKYMESPEGRMLFKISEDSSESSNLIDELPVTAGYYQQLMRPHKGERPAGSPANRVDVNKLSNDTIRKLKELGYVK